MSSFWTAPVLYSPIRIPRKSTFLHNSSMKKSPKFTSSGTHCYPRNPKKNLHEIHFQGTSTFAHGKCEKEFSQKFTTSGIWRQSLRDSCYKWYWQMTLTNDIDNWHWQLTLTKFAFLFFSLTSFLTGAAVDFSSLDALGLGWLLRGRPGSSWLWRRLIVWCCALGLLKCC